MSRNKGNSLEIFPSSFVIVDIETTGFSPVNDKIIEFAGIKVINNRLVDTYSTLINPCRRLNSNIEELTGICSYDLINEPVIEEVIDDIANFIDTDIIVAHNAHFDINFLYEDFYNYCNFELSNDFVDTLKMARRLLPELRGHKLGMLAEYFGIDQGSSHRALGDCETLFKVYNNLKMLSSNRVLR